jgi:NADPH-dependent 2,4-dienoyl-CoA reductase/sulfur reductase-like enzyme
MLRGLDDALALRDAFAARPRLAVVGAGFIGCEVAATARKRGLDVTLIDIADQPMTALGPVVGARCADMHRERGVDLRLGAGIEGFEGAGRLEAVRLADGTRIEADLAVVALGAVPNTDWLADSGLELQPGVVCDATLAARDADGVFAAGDAAAWPHPMAGGGTIRIEHWTNAAEQGAAAARNLLAEPAERTPYEAVPYFWSDQYETKIQSVGLPARAQRVTVLEATPEGDKLVLGGERDGRLIAAIAFNAPRRLMFYRQRLAALPPFDDVVAAVRADEKALGDPKAVAA